jgi:nudix-type nucleoside diphosphatase (YffH/AdpP family)
MGKAALALMTMDGLDRDARLDDPALRALLADPARLEFWQAATGGRAADDRALELRLAQDILAAMGQVPADRLRARRGSMLVRAASALRAVAGAPTGIRHPAAPGDVQEGPRRTTHAGFFAVEELDLRFRRFDGTASAQVHREVFIGCDAVTVLPYDPLRDRVLLIEQMRVAPLARGEANPWQIEAVAGRIDPGETPEEAALREAEEEAGLRLARLLKVAEYYPTTGAFSEYLYAYVALADLPDGTAGLHGVADEAEDIRGHLLTFEDAMARLRAGEFTCGPLILTLLWLDSARPGLRAAAGGPI